MKLPVFSLPKIRRRLTRRPAPGAPPGTLEVSPESAPTTLALHRYDADRYAEEQVEPDDLVTTLPGPAAGASGPMVWLEVLGLGDGAMVKRLGEALQLHPLTVEDIVHTHQRPKVEAFERYLFVVWRAVFKRADGAVDNEQVSMVVCPGLVVTFQERAGAGFDPVRIRLRQGRGHIRRGGADYLAHALFDATLDNYFPLLDDYADALDRIEDQVLQNPSPQNAESIHVLRRELRYFRRAVWPAREVAAALGRGDLPQIGERTLPAFRDCHDHAVHLAEFVENSRERASDLAQLQATLAAERNNEVMKVLTIMASIFIPLTFLCGLWGMNFDPAASPYNMPELKWRYGYPLFWGAAGLTVASMVLLFRLKGWVGAGRSASPTSPPSSGPTANRHDLEQGR